MLRPNAQRLHGDRSCPVTMPSWDAIWCWHDHTKWTPQPSLGIDFDVPVKRMCHLCDVVLLNMDLEIDGGTLQ